MSVSQRDHILLSALDGFAHRGIAATTIQDVADSAHASKANVLYHFSSKEQLVDATLTPTLDALEELISRAETAGIREEGTRDHFIDGFVDLLIDYRLGIHVVLSHPYLASEIPSLARAFGLMERLAVLVSEQTSGEKDRLRFGVAVSGAAYALVSSGILGVEQLDEQSLRETLRDVLRRMVLADTPESVS